MSEVSATVRVPRGPEDLTAAWLQDVLNPTGGTLHVASVDVQPVGVGIGVMSILFRATPAYAAGSGPRSVIVKLAPPLPQVREIAAGYAFYHREVEVYRQLGGELGFRPPAVHLAHHDPTDDSFVIVMEDLSNLRTVDQLAGCSIDDARAIVDELARHHARWWENPRLDVLPFIQAWHEPPYPAFNGQAGAQTWPISRERYGHLIPPRIVAIGERWADVGPALMTDQRNHQRTMCHGDLRLDNMFFHDDGADPVSLVDWQITSRSPGAFDLAYFTSQSLTVEDRRAHEQELLQRYHEGLCAGGVTGYGAGDLWDDYRRSALFCLCYPLQAGAVELANDRAVALASAMLERSIATIVDLDADELAP